MRAARRRPFAPARRGIRQAPRRKCHDEEEPFLRMARQVGERQDGWQEKKPERAASPRPAVAPESPGIPAGPPHVRVMTLERVGQQEWRRLVYGGGDCRRQPPLRGRPHQNVNAEASPQQMADRQPAECGRAAGPPHGPDRRIKHPRLRVAHERASAEPAGVPERRVPMPGNRAGDREVVRQKQEREIVAERRGSPWFA